MDDLISSSSFKSVLSCSEAEAQPEESSWTDYFVDFMMSEEEKKRQGASYCTFDQDEEEEEGSMISDAASLAPAAVPDRYKGLKKLKKKVFKALDHDDSLEDTASSPVNSPKVSALSQLEFSPKRRCNITDLAKVAGIGNDHGRDGMDCEDADVVMEGVRFLDQSQRGITPCAELKDKGLCLVPLSMLLNYQG
ncbi:hypothetical protein D1007_20461 [Hordeum vulgare]|uniref:Uncharacterized protein n=1 Tax=Hordeum vulgare subsp. vulgare TaxID=112509 RepID=A0A8I7B5Q5_HORVV|nr:vascular-related unknown protein 1-like [Hordeum vulgare subsp. vulgare]KAE8803620.1 hypothetical protein D1007_20461 [Hordeum vulgare]KAI5013221.1 hypothetical protein ZWY2020_028175 [Hordeum vulgare]